MAAGKTGRGAKMLQSYFNRGESGEWGVGSGKWEVGSGKWEVGSGK